jgi:hypothetical protein
MVGSEGECQNYRFVMGKRVDLFGRDKGLGDTVARAIRTVSRNRIKECGGCKDRRDKLNKIFPYRDVEARK